MPQEHLLTLDALLMKLEEMHPKNRKVKHTLHEELGDDDSVDELKMSKEEYLLNLDSLLMKLGETHPKHWKVKHRRALHGEFGMPDDYLVERKIYSTSVGVFKVTVEEKFTATCLVFSRGRSYFDYNSIYVLKLISGGKVESTLENEKVKQLYSQIERKIMKYQSSD